MKQQAIDRLLYMITATYFLLLIFVLVLFGYTPTNDGDGYIELALQCVAEHQPYPITSLYMGQPFVWNSGAINLVVLSLGLTGSIMPLLVLMCILKAFSALFSARIAQRLFGNRTAVATILIFALYPNNWGQSTTILSEIPMIFCILAAVMIALKHCGNIKMMLVSGVLIGIANWFRPVAPVFLFALVFQFLFFAPHHKKLRQSIALITGFALSVTLIGGEAYFRTGKFVFQSTSFWYNMADDAYDGATVDPHFGEELYKKGTPRFIEDRENKTCFECAEIWKSRCLPWLLTHKMEYLSKIPGRLYYMYKNDHDNMAAFLDDKSNAETCFVTIPLRHIVSEFKNLSFAQYLSLITLFLYLIILLSAIGGTVILARLRQWKSLFLPLFIIVGGTFSLVLLTQGETRFKDPYMPFIMMLSAVCFVHFLFTKQQKL